MTALIPRLTSWVIKISHGDDEEVDEGFFFQFLCGHLHILHFYVVRYQI